VEELSARNVKGVKIDKNKLPNNEAFNANMAALLDIDQFVNHYTPEWNYPVDKAILIAFLKEFHRDIAQNNAGNDYELNLLSVILMTYLYNLDEIDYYEEITSTLEKMQTDFSNEFRTYWLYGNFLIRSEGYIARPLGRYKGYVP
jgi:hypothetical protein